MSAFFPMRIFGEKAAFVHQAHANDQFLEVHLMVGISVTRTVRQHELFAIELSRTFGSGSVQNDAEPLHCMFLQVLDQC